MEHIEEKHMWCRCYGCNGCNFKNGTMPACMNVAEGVQPEAHMAKDRAVLCRSCRQAGGAPTH